MKTKTKTYRTKEKKTERKKGRNLNIVEHSIWKKKRKKEEKKSEHFWTVIVTLFWLVVKGKFLSLLEFKGDIRNFFSLFILWNLTKTINRGFDTRFTNICNYIDSKNFFF